MLDLSLENVLLDADGSVKIVPDILHECITNLNSVILESPVKCKRFHGIRKGRNTEGV